MVEISETISSRVEVAKNITFDAFFKYLNNFLIRQRMHSENEKSQFKSERSGYEDFSEDSEIPRTRRDFDKLESNVRQWKENQVNFHIKIDKRNFKISSCKLARFNSSKKMSPIKRRDNSNSIWF